MKKLHAALFTSALLAGSAFAGIKSIPSADFAAKGPIATSTSDNCMEAGDGTGRAFCCTSQGNCHWR